MSRRPTAVLAGLLAATLVTACGTNHAATAPVFTKTVTVVEGHGCRPGNQAMQCVLPAAPVRAVASSVDRTIHGVDFAWGAPTVYQMQHVYFARFGASYLSHDGAKGWTQRQGLVASYHAAGLPTVAVWETGATRAAEGCAAGRADALEAKRQAATLGNTTRPIDFAIDFEATGPQVDSYFRCGHAVLGSRESAYGSYDALKYLCARGLVGHTNWQTYAWSHGQWLPASCAPLQQFLNGSSVDYDRAIAPDYGQWPFTPSVRAGAVRAAKRRSRHAHEALRRELHADIDRHHCRPGQHATPRSYHTVCHRWLVKGNQAIAVIQRYRKEGIR